MPGANYMGGRRNAMKARAKDTIGRQEKGYFGRQRLNILSQGISTSKPSERPIQLDPSSSKVRVEIDLAHAKQKVPINEDTATTWFIPSPIHVSPCTPRSRRRIRTKDAHTSSSSRRSKVLDVLDTTQPLFFKAMRERILAMPDLACLSKEVHSDLTSEKGQHVESQSKNDITSTERPRNDCEISDPRSKIEDIQEPVRTNATFPNSKKLHSTPSRTRWVSQGDESFGSRLLRNNKVKRGTSSSTSSLEASFAEENSSRGFQDNYFSEFYGEQGIYCSPWSTQLRQSSSQTSEDINALFSDQTQSPRHNSAVRKYRMGTISSPGSEGIGQRVSEFGDENDGLPSLIKLGPLRLQSTRNKSSDDQATAYGSLFEQSDPWSTIGLILGLHEAQRDRSTPDLLFAGEEINEVEDGDHDFSFLFGDGWPNDEQDISDGEPLIEDIWQDLVPSYKEMPTPSVFESIQKSPSPVEYDDGRQMVQKEPFSSDESAQEDCLGDGVAEEFYLSKLRPEDDMMLIEHDSHTGECVSVTRNRTNILESTDSTIDQMSIEMNEPETGGLYDGIGDDIIVDAEDTLAPEVFAVPALKEVNGRFLGPSLFDDLEDSD